MNESLRCPFNYQVKRCDGVCSLYLNGKCSIRVIAESLQKSSAQLGTLHGTLQNQPSQK